MERAGTQGAAGRDGTTTVVHRYVAERGADAVDAGVRSAVLGFGANAASSPPLSPEEATADSIRQLREAFAKEAATMRQPHVEAALVASAAEAFAAQGVSLNIDCRPAMCLGTFNAQSKEALLDRAHELFQWAHAVAHDCGFFVTGPQQSSSGSGWESHLSFECPDGRQLDPERYASGRF